MLSALLLCNGFNISLSPKADKERHLPFAKRISLVIRYVYHLLKTTFEKIENMSDIFLISSDIF